jgi:hypothetical protein
MWKFYIVTAVYLGNMLGFRLVIGLNWTRGRYPTLPMHFASETVRAVRGAARRAARAEGCGAVCISSSYV